MGKGALASALDQQVVTKARAGVALNGHPNAEAGMFVVVVQDPGSQKFLRFRAVFNSAKVPRHIGVAVQIRQPIYVVGSETPQGETVAGQPVVSARHEPQVYSPEDYS